MVVLGIRHLQVNTTLKVLWDQTAISSKMSKKNLPSRIPQPSFQIIPLPLVLCRLHNQGYALRKEGSKMRRTNERRYR